MFVVLFIIVAAVVVMLSCFLSKNKGDEIIVETCILD